MAKTWKCGCGEVTLTLEGEPYFNLDCHCSACTPVSKYLDAKSGGKGISSIINTTGVAKAFYMLDKVKFETGKDKIAGVKLGESGPPPPRPPRKSGARCSRCLTKLD